MLLKLGLVTLVGLNAECIRGKRSTAMCGATEYNECNDRCCGGVLYSVHFTEFSGEDTHGDTRQCCGNNVDGTWFDADTGDDTTTNLCCSAWYTFTDPDDATDKTHVIHSGVSTDRQCCVDGTTVPKVFDVLTEMCCNGNVAFAGDTAHSSCCGDVSYDRRLKSCPCHNGVLHDTPSVDDPDTEADETEGKNLQCCHNGDPAVKSLPYDASSEICCTSGEVGGVDTHVCCGDSILAPTVTGTDILLECCETGAGFVGINLHTDFCCGGTVKARTKPYPEEACCEFDSDAEYDGTLDVCCPGGVTRGDACCGDTGYDSAFQLCCESETDSASWDKFEGADLTLKYDSCCSAEPYLAADKICCDDTLSSSTGAGGEDYTACCGSTPMEGSGYACCDLKVLGPFEYPSCCGSTAYDGKTQTCCGLTITANPTVTADDGSTYTSSTTRCCQEEDGDSWTWKSYDYVTKTCCGRPGGSHRGVIVDAETDGECCGDGYIGAGELCCTHMDVTTGVASTHGEHGECCGTLSTFDRTTHFCCNADTGDVCEIVAGVAEMACGTEVFSTSTHMCCEDGIRELHGVPYEDAICCGTTCVDATKYWCCDGEIYTKGDPLNTKITKPHLECCTGTDCDVCTCEWTNWSTDCSSSTCGVAGTLTRERTVCEDGAGTICTGGDDEGDTETKACTGSCDSDVCTCSWSDWSGCSTTCDPGMDTRTRVCKDGADEDCSTGEDIDTAGFTEMKMCNFLEADVCCVGDFCDWTDWSDYSTCSKKDTVCNVGRKKRTRRCKVPGEIEGTEKCPGKRKKSKVCNKKNKYCGLKCDDPEYDLVILANTPEGMDETKFESIRKFANELNKAANTIEKPGEIPEWEWRMSLNTYHCVPTTFSQLQDSPATSGEVTKIINGDPDALPTATEPWGFVNPDRTVKSCANDNKLGKAMKALLEETEEVVRERRHITREPEDLSEFFRENVTYTGILIIIMDSEVDDKWKETMYDIKNEMEKVIVIGVGDDVTEEYVQEVASYTSYWEGDIFYKHDEVHKEIFTHHHHVLNYTDLPALATEILSDVCSTAVWPTDECDVDNGGCAHICSTTYVGKQCACKDTGGYFLGPYGRNCYTEHDRVLEDLGISVEDAKLMADKTADDLATYVADKPELSIHMDYFTGFLPHYRTASSGGRA